MVFNVANTAGAGNPVAVFDANGIEIHECMEANIETGRCIVAILNEDGSRFVFQNSLQYQPKMFPAPLTVVPVSELTQTKRITNGT